MLVDTEISADVVVREFKNLFLTCFPVRRQEQRLKSSMEARMAVGVSMEGLNYQLDYVRERHN